MKAFFEDKFNYNFDCNAELIALIGKTPSLYTPAISRLLCHTFSAQHIWNRRLAGAASQYEVWELFPLEDLARINLECHQESMAVLNLIKPDHRIVYQNTQGVTFENKAEDILFHIINHGTYHRGQIMTRIKEAGALPLITDFIHYKR